MKSVINDLLPTDARARRRRGLVSESQERILNHILPLHRLGKRSELVYCPYCKRTTKTRVEQSDSKTTKGVHAILWMGMGDPFALTAHDWCQNIDHFCASCNGHLAHKPYRGQAQAIPEDSVLELPLGYHHETAELPSSPNHVSELQGHQRFTVQREANKEVVLGSHSSESQASRILNPAELDWEIYQPSLTSHDQASVLTEVQETEPLELLAENNPRSSDLQREWHQNTAEARNPNKIKRKPVESGREVDGRRAQDEKAKALTLANRPQQQTRKKPHHHFFDK